MEMLDLFDAPKRKVDRLI